MTDGNLTPEERRALARRLRTEEGMSIPQISERLGVHKTTIRSYLRGLPPPNTPGSRAARSASRRHPDHNEAQVAARRAEAFEMRLAGMNPSQIAVKMGIHRATVRGYIEIEVASLIQPKAAEMRAVENERLDHLLIEAKEVLEKGKGTELALKAIDRILNISRRRSALNGLDMPLRVDLHSVELTQQDLALQELLNEAEARNATIEGEIVGKAAVTDDADTAATS